MGEFETEFDLFVDASMRLCFVAAKIPPEGASTDLQQPGGNISFSRRLIGAHDAIVSMVTKDERGLTSFPPF